MNSIEASRQFIKDYDLSHSELASLLNISRSMASMVVSGRRSLPIDAEIRMFELMHLVNENAGKSRSQSLPAIEAPDKEIGKLKKLLQRQLIDNGLQLIRIEDELRTHEKNFSHASSTWKNIEEIAAVLAPETMEAYMFDNKRKDKLRKMMRSSEAVRLQLSIKKDLLLAEANVISQYLSANA